MSLELRDIVLAAIAAATDLPRDKVDEDLELLELGLDSLDLSAIIVDIEDAVGGEVPAAVLDRLLQDGELTTVGSVLGLLSTWDPSQAPDPDRADPRHEIVVVSEW